MDVAGGRTEDNLQALIMSVVTAAAPAFREAR